MEVHFLSKIALQEALYKQRVRHTVALPFTLKKYLKAKEELWKIQIFHHVKI
jgi:hypothetical protein